MPGDALPFPAPPGVNSLAPTENLKAPDAGLSESVAGFGEDQGEPDGERELAALLPPGVSMPGEAVRRNEPERESEGREPGVTEP